MAKQNTPRQNYGNPFSAGSSVAQGAALAAPGFVDYSQFFDTSATPGLQAAQQGLFTQIAVANEQHTKNMQNILPANFDETQVAPSNLAGFQDRLSNHKNKYVDFSRKASNLRGTKEGDIAMMELNKIRSQIQKDYGNNVEYNSMMLDHDKNKDQYSQLYTVSPGKAEEYSKFVKFVDPAAKIYYDNNDIMMVEAADGDKISLEELRKLEPAMKQTTLNQSIQGLGAQMLTDSMNGKITTNEQAMFFLDSYFTKADMDNKNIQDSILSAATDLTFKVNGEELNFTNYIKSDPTLSDKYIVNGQFKSFENPTERDNFYKELKKEFSSYFIDAVGKQRDINIKAFESKQAQAVLNKLNAEKDLVTYKSNEQIRVRNATFNPQGGVGLQESEAELIKRMKYINDAVDRGDLSAFQAYGLDGKNALDISQDTNGLIDINMYGTDPSVSGTYGLDKSSTIFTGQAQTPEDKVKLKQALFNTIIGKKWTNLSEKAGINLGATTSQAAVQEEGNEVELNEETLTKIIADLDKQKNEKGFFVTGEDGVIYTDPNTGEKTTREDYKEYVSMLDGLVEEREKSEAAGNVNNDIVTKVKNRAEELNVILNNAQDQERYDELLRSHLGILRGIALQSSDATKAKVEEILANYK